MSDRSDLHARFNTALMLHAANKDDLGSELALAVGVLLGANMPGCAAAVVVLGREKYPEQFTMFLGGESGPPDA